MQKKFINPETMPPTFGYSHVVEVTNNTSHSINSKRKEA